VPPRGYRKNLPKNSGWWIQKKRQGGGSAGAGNHEKKQKGSDTPSAEKKRRNETHKKELTRPCMAPVEKGEKKNEKTSLPKKKNKTRRVNCRKLKGRYSRQKDTGAPRKKSTAK